MILEPLKLDTVGRKLWREASCETLDIFRDWFTFLFWICPKDATDGARIYLDFPETPIELAATVFCFRLRFEIFGVDLIPDTTDYVWANPTFLGEATLNFGPHV